MEHFLDWRVRILALRVLRRAYGAERHKRLRVVVNGGKGILEYPDGASVFQS